MNRRRFERLLGSAAAWCAVQPRLAFAAAPAPSAWPDSTYRRILVDNNIPDWDPRFLAKLDSAAFVDLLADSGYQAIMQYARSNTGLCFWPTRAGEPHRNLKGRDLLGEVIGHCRRRGLRTLVYFNNSKDNWAYEHHPEWRVVRADGQNPMLGHKGLVCPNTPYRQYVVSVLKEIGSYDIDGLFFDNTYWMDVCYCPHCVARYRKETGREAPRLIDWDDRNWRDFQKAREAWMIEYVRELCETARAARPITVNFQLSGLLTADWMIAQPNELAALADYAGGDFYRGPADYSLACKLFYGLSRRQPFEFHTSRTRTPGEYTTTKTLDELRVEAHVATLHSGALVIIDGISPDGTLEPEVYHMLGQLNRELAPYEPYLGGELKADIGLYLDKESMYDPDKQHVSPAGLSHSGFGHPHLQAVSGAARVLREEHLPFGVITNATLDQLSRYRAVILSDVLEMTREQATVFRAFVRKGGLLYGSGTTSLDRLEKPEPRFLLEDVFGVRYVGKLGTKLTYLAPSDDSLLTSIWPQRWVSFSGPMVEARAISGARVLATVTVPFVPLEQVTAIGNHFASTNSDPPAFEPGPSPACVVNSYGAGKAIWICAPFERGAEAVNHKLLAHLLRSELKPPFRFEADAHPSVEVVLFEQPGKRRLSIGLLSMQQQMPAIPVDAAVRVKIPESKSVKSVLRVPERRALPFAVRGPYVEFRTEPFHPFTMVSIEHD